MVTRDTRYAFVAQGIEKLQGSAPDHQPEQRCIPRQRVAPRDNNKLNADEGRRKQREPDDAPL